MSSYILKISYILVLWRVKKHSSQVETVSNMILAKAVIKWNIILEYLNSFAYYYSKGLNTSLKKSKYAAWWMVSDSFWSWCDFPLIIRFWDCFAGILSSPFLMYKYHMGKDRVLDIHTTCHHITYSGRNWGHLFPG